MEIRIATEKDIDNLVEVYLDWEKFKGILPDALAEPDNYNDLIKYFNESNSTRKYFLVIDSNIPVAACYIDKTFLNLKNVRLGDMIVRDGYRRKGIGTLLLNEVIKFSKVNDVKKIWLWTQEELDGAQKFYLSNGFILEGRQKNQFCEKDALLFGLII